MFRGYRLFKYFSDREMRLGEERKHVLKVENRGKFISLIFEILVSIQN